MVSRVALATRAETAVFTVLLSASNACLRIGATPALESLTGLRGIFRPKNNFENLSL